MNTAGCPTVADVALLSCPDCAQSLSHQGSGQAWLRGSLRCGGCLRAWPIEQGIPCLYEEQQVVGNDRLMRRIYDALPRLHDPLTRMLFPLLQGVREGEVRQRYLRRLELGRLEPRGDRPLRILEVGVGAGANLPLLQGALPAGCQAEIWGVDLSRGMLRLCQEQLPSGGCPVRLLLADAHALPFPASSFDRVFHIGGIGGYRDARRALAEMARVACDGTPLVVVDEQLDPRAARSLLHRALFRLLTFYDPDPRCPRHLLPAAAEDVLEEQLSRYYYGLRFRMPVRRQALEPSHDA